MRLLLTLPRRSRRRVLWHGGGADQSIATQTHNAQHGQVSDVQLIVLKVLKVLKERRREGKKRKEGRALAGLQLPVSGLASMSFLFSITFISFHPICC
jgi:hypothetical protein